MVFKNLFPAHTESQREDTLICGFRMKECCRDHVQRTGPEMATSSGMGRRGTDEGECWWIV